MALLKCEDLSVGYEGRAVVAGLNFEVNSGEYLCIVGENGSGKTTLMKTILRLRNPLSGKITMGEGLKSKEIGYMPQLSETQKDFPASVREIVRSGCLNQCGFRPFYNAEEKQKADRYMEMLGILELKKRCYSELSGGQQKRVLLARALCATQKILLLDEPVAGLDPNAISGLYENIKDINDSGIAIIMISHDITASVEFASHILHLGAQSTLFYGKTADYATSEYGSLYIKSKRGVSADG